MQSRCKKHCRWNERLRFNHITTLRRRMQVSKSFCGNAKRIKINSVLKVCLESRAFSLFQISLRGYLKKSKISSISTNAAGFCVKNSWNPQRIPAALCLKSCLCLRNIRHFLCFQIYLKKGYIPQVYLNRIYPYIVMRIEYLVKFTAWRALLWAKSRSTAPRPQ